MDQLLPHIDAAVGSGKAVVSADESNIVDIVKETIKGGRTASFYLTPSQARAVKTWFWTPERVKASRIRVVSDEEKDKIKSELGIEVNSFRCSRIKCVCGHTYGGFEFLQQGVQQHGLDAVKAVFELKSSTFLQANPTFVAICPECQEILRGGIEYDCDQYGGCCCCLESLKLLPGESYASE